jgi:hypothetical protein
VRESKRGQNKKDRCEKGCHYHEDTPKFCGNGKANKKNAQATEKSEALLNKSSLWNCRRHG